jgi:hypothetical protein
MNKLAIFLDKNYFYIIIFLILIAISGSIFVLRNKNEIELTKKVGDQYLNLIMLNRDFNNDHIMILKKISSEKSNFAGLASILTANFEYKRNNVADGDDDLLKLVNDNSKNKILRDYSLYLYGHSLLSRMDLQKFAEILPKLSDKSNIFYKNNLELIAVFYMYKKDYSNAFKIIDDNMSSINNIDTLKSRLENIKSEIDFSEKENTQKSLS